MKPYRTIIGGEVFCYEFYEQALRMKPPTFTRSITESIVLTPHWDSNNETTVLFELSTPVQMGIVNTNIKWFRISRTYLRSNG